MRELEALTGAGLADYFLIVEDFCNWANDHDIILGRAVLPGSLIPYILGITAVDPIK